MRPEGDDESNEGGEGDENVHGRKSAPIQFPPTVAVLSVHIDFLPSCWHDGLMLRTVAVVVQEPVAAFELGVLCEVFGIDRTDDGVPAFDFRVCASRPGEIIRSTSGIGVVATHGLDAARDADLVAVPAGTVDGPFEPEILQVLRETVERGGRVLSVCSGAFTLAAAGLLDGRACTTHWRYAARLAEVCPDAEVDLDVLYVEDGPIITSAGTAAGIDACLHLVRTELGSEVATRIARRMVVPPHRSGGQRQYVESPVPDQPCDSLQDVLDAVLEHLDGDHTVASLARQAAMSERTFARRFSAEVGTTPHQWLTAQRVLRARHLLETTDLDVERIARESGFATGAVLRHHFQRQIGVPPQAYRKAFTRQPASA
jgi:transcriptional regulator GlxA family with amidase domain